MPTRNPRINVTLKPEHYDLISRLSRVQERSRADVLRELFETVLPVLERVVVVSEAAERAQVQAKEGLRESAERAEAAILPHVAEAMGQLDAFVEDAVGQLTRGGAGQVGRRAATPDSPAPPGRRGVRPRAVTRGPVRGAGGGASRARKGRRKGGRS